MSAAVSQELGQPDNRRARQLLCRLLFNRSHMHRWLHSVHSPPAGEVLQAEQLQAVLRLPNAKREEHSYSDPGNPAAVYLQPQPKKDRPRQAIAFRSAAGEVRY